MTAKKNKKQKSISSVLCLSWGWALIHGSELGSRKGGEETRDMTGLGGCKKGKLLFSPPVYVIIESISLSLGWEGAVFSFFFLCGRKAFFFTSGWRSCFVLTFDIGTLVGWEFARWNSLGSHLATFIKLLWFV